jgi:hypothetical protein
MRPVIRRINKIKIKDILIGLIVTSNSCEEKILTIDIQFQPEGFSNNRHDAIRRITYE